MEVVEIMKQVLIKGGAAYVEEVPAPAVGPNTVLVQTHYSCISAGTEMAGLVASGMPLYRRALKQPENVKRVMEMVRDEGLGRTVNRVRGKLSSGSPTGYSAAGEVVAVGENVEGFAPGDRVACAGAGIANHAELINVPVNLCVPIAEGVRSDWASTVTLGAIALQGIRRTQPTLGETVVVVGLGILGQISCQILRAAGCRVIGVDPDLERVELATSLGCWKGIDPSSDDYPDKVRSLTQGFGADAAVITAASASNDIASDAMRACRKKGRVVLVGDVGLGLKRSDMYAKELDFLISCSYGPGRYDPVYEEAGQDYPLPYVRWTENRNMEAYIQLLADANLDLSRLIQATHPVDDAGVAYESLGAPGQKPLIVLLEYPQEAQTPKRALALREPAQKVEGTIRVGVVGPGGFAQGVHLPNLVKLRRFYAVEAISSRTGATAKAVGKQYDAGLVATDHQALLDSAAVDLVIIATRHDLHAATVLQALHAGKHVFVEKPLALNAEELGEIKEFYATNPDAPVLMTGFNRRFSPAAREAKRILEGRSSPLIANYRMNAGYIAADHWVHGPEGGGRNIGEACHIYDLFNYLVGAAPTEVTATPIATSSKAWRANDNFVATIAYADGSVCTLTYTALGSKAYPKERMDLFCDGLVVSLDDYKALSVKGSSARGWSGSVDKGHYEELRVLASAIKEGSVWPISLEEQLFATETSFEVERQLQ